MVAARAATSVHTGRRLRAAQRRETVGLRLWLPLTPLFWLLSPFALLLAPLLLVWLPRTQRPRRPYAAAIKARPPMLVSLSGTVIDIDAPGARLFIRIFLRRLAAT